MITIIARWESEQVEPEFEHRMWRQLKGAFAVEPADIRLVFVPVLHESKSIEQYDTMEEALLSADRGRRVFLEPTGYNPVSNIPQDDDIVIVVGNTAHSNMEHATVEETYAIATPAGPTKGHLYGINAAAIALATRWGQ